MKVLIKSFFISIGISLVALLVLSVLLAKTSMNESVMPIRNYFYFFYEYTNWRISNRKKYEVKRNHLWGLFWIMLYVSFVFHFERSKYEFLNKFRSSIDDFSRNFRWNDWWDIRSKFIKIS